METIVRKSELVKELYLVQGIVERKNSIPILSNVLLDARDGRLRISATDLDVSVRCGCEAQVKSPGAITLAAKKLYEIARSLPEGDIHIKVLPDSWATIESGRVTFKMAGLPKEDFPALPEPSGKGGFEVAAEDMRDLIARTSFAITGEDARYYLTGALLVLDNEGIAMVTTDGHRLSYARRKSSLKLSEPQRLLIPRKAIHELGRLLELGEAVTLRQSENHLLFSVGDRLLSSKTIEGQFPAFEKVVAFMGDKTVTLDRDLLAAAIKRVSLLSSERSRSLKMSLAPGKLELAASSPDVGEARESVTTEYHGDTVDIAFNAQYLLDFLTAVGTPSVTLQLKNADSQGLLRPGSEGETDYRYVVMPMRL
jgi:DNA polymerase III subunit beta